MIKFVHKGSFKNTEAFLERNKKMDIYKTLQKYGEQGVEALREHTPKDTGKTADSWSYEIVETRKGYKIYFRNSNFNDGVPIAVILQYGHGTGTGGYVEGQDYINPALQLVFENLADEAWEEVTK